MAIVGANGFIGKNLAVDLPNSELYTRANIASLAESEAQTLIVAAAPAVKWKANLESEKDFSEVSHLWEQISRSKARECILISTIDVFPRGVIFTESSQLPPEIPEAYGRNRGWLEGRIKERFDISLIVRLPGMYGNGLKKNVIFDLVNKRQDVKLPNGGDTFQWWDVSDIAEKVLQARQHSVNTLNLASEPISFSDLAMEVFKIEVPIFSEDILSYNMRSEYVQPLSGLRSDYFYQKQEVVSKLKTWIDSAQRT